VYENTIIRGYLVYLGYLTPSHYAPPMHVCMYMFVCVYLTHLYTLFNPTFTLTHSHTHTLIHSYTHTLTHSHTHTLIHSYTHTHTHTLSLIGRAGRKGTAYTFVSQKEEQYAPSMAKLLSKGTYPNTIIRCIILCVTL
jgi:hypothetical protein